MADAPNANDELYPIAVLIDELKVRGAMPPASASARRHRVSGDSQG